MLSASLISTSVPWARVIGRAASGEGGRNPVRSVRTSTPSSRAAAAETVAAASSIVSVSSVPFRSMYSRFVRASVSISDRGICRVPKA